MCPGTLQTVKPRLDTRLWLEPAAMKTAKKLPWDLVTGDRIRNPKGGWVEVVDVMGDLKDGKVSIDCGRDGWVDLLPYESVCVALSDSVQARHIKPGDRVLVEGFVRHVVKRSPGGGTLWFDFADGGGLRTKYFYHFERMR